MWPFKPQPTQLKLQVVGKPASKLRLDELRADPEMAKASSEILNNPMFQVMIQVNRNESPALMALTLDSTLETRALHQARIEGFNMALRNFEAMGEHQAIPETMTATFEEEERAL